MESQNSNELIYIKARDKDSKYIVETLKQYGGIPSVSNETFLEDSLVYINPVSKKIAIAFKGYDEWDVVKTFGKEVAVIDPNFKFKVGDKVVINEEVLTVIEDRSYIKGENFYTIEYCDGLVIEDKIRLYDGCKNWKEYTKFHPDFVERSKRLPVSELHPWYYSVIKINTLIASHYGEYVHPGEPAFIIYVNEYNQIRVSDRMWNYKGGYLRFSTQEYAKEFLEENPDLLAEHFNLVEQKK